MSEIKAQLYAGNPLSISDDELAQIERACSAIGTLPKKLAMRNPPKTSLVNVYDDEQTRGTPQTRIGHVIGTFSAAGAHPGGGADFARLLIAAAQYLHLLPQAIRELRAQAPEAEQARWRESVKGVRHATE